MMTTTDSYHYWHGHLTFRLTFPPFSSPQSACLYYLYLLLHEYESLGNFDFAWFF